MCLIKGLKLSKEMCDVTISCDSHIHISYRQFAIMRLQYIDWIVERSWSSKFVLMTWVIRELLAFYLGSTQCERTIVRPANCYQESMQKHCCHQSWSVYHTPFQVHTLSFAFFTFLVHLVQLSLASKQTSFALYLFQFLSLTSACCRFFVSQQKGYHHRCAWLLIGSNHVSVSWMTSWITALSHSYFASVDAMKGH